ncbi:hypothetical protein JOC36_001085 [Weissella uvarum]|uniref:hypothetical protein n=1 Tax=Weissella uvarum TaxID=1479233 RepID=UPI001960DC48|nr:hypothetical protein [Weissella uvarum]MBM7617528.1 hypothetical protein [Weissella uvarum]MCM0595588.1 hypothetical protein [Weissella uvarum]
MKIVILIGTLIAILCFLTIFRRTGRRLTERQIIQSQQIVNAAMTQACNQLNDSIGIKQPQSQLRSTLVANIWGHEVMAFEFILPIERVMNRELIRTQLNAALENYAQAHAVSKISDDEPALLVTDLWFNQEQTVLHVDVAHVDNEETLAYLHDLRRLNQSV